MLPSVKVTCVRLGVLLLLCQCATSLIIPEEVPTLLSLVYSNIPPVKTGTDSRLGIGFRLGEHADFQVVVELGPQEATRSIGGEDDNKIRRAAMVTAAMRGEYGPWTQAITKYQLEQSLKKELQKIKANKLKSATSKQSTKIDGQKTQPNDWLSKWSKQQEGNIEGEYRPIEKTKPVNRMRVIESRIDDIQKNEDRDKASLDELEKIKAFYNS